MRDEDKTKEQLISQLHELRQRVLESEKDKEERKQAEKTLAGSEARYRAVVENQTELITGFCLRGSSLL